MGKKERVSIILLMTILTISIFLIGCNKGVEITVNQTDINNSTNTSEFIEVVNETVSEEQAIENDNSTDNPSVIEYICGNAVCDPSENCSICPLDCGYCKVEFEGNYSLEEFQRILRKRFGKDLNFRRVVEENDTAADFYIANTRTLKKIASFKDINYVQKKDIRRILLSKIVDESFYIQNSGLLFDFVNRSRYFLTETPIDNEKREYEARFKDDKAILDYPKNPTGYDDKYDNWTLSNYTKQEKVILDNIKMYGDAVKDSFASITDYNVSYKFVSLYIKKDDEIMYDYATVNEKRVSFIYSVDFACSPNLVITIYDNTFDVEKEITEENIKKKAEASSESLLKDVDFLRHECKALSNMRFTTDIDQTANSNI